ncbi:MAG: alpha/beta hydrolase fold domain-containing protein [Thermosynechococcaceae cyanobacterium]
MATLFQNWRIILTSALCLTGLFFSFWIVLPAPVESLLFLSVGAPEVSPWLIGGNAIALLLILSYKRTTLSLVLIGCSTLALVLSSLPLLQLSSAHKTADTALYNGLGPQYLTTIASQKQDLFRPQPYALVDSFRGIPEPTVRQQSVPFAQSDNVPLNLEIFQPAASGLYPGIVAIYGGAWRRGSPLSNLEFNRYIAAQGYVVWAVDYRHAPDHRFPGQLQDIQTALTFLQDHAAEYETDPQRLVLMGRSAGAHLAMLAAYAAPQASVRAVVNYYGPVDLTEGYLHPPVPDPINSRAVLNDFLGGSPSQLAEKYRQASPITYVTQPVPPTLLIYGRRDHIVQAKYGKQLDQALKATKSQAVYIEIPWADHAFDAVFNGVSNQLALYHTERFIAWALRQP